MLLNENLESIYKQKVSGIYLKQEYWQNKKNVFLCTIQREWLSSYLLVDCNKIEHRKEGALNFTM